MTGLQYRTGVTYIECVEVRNQLKDKPKFNCVVNYLAPM